MNDETRSTVCLTVDFDAVCIWMSWGARGARVLSRGEFGAREQLRACSICSSGRALPQPGSSPATRRTRGRR